MGYDMTIVKNRESLQNDKVRDAAKQALDSMRVLLDVQREAGLLQTLGDLDRYLSASKDFEACCERLLDPGYFRLNNRGMWRYTEAMEEVGMVVDGDESPRLDWESLPDPAEEGEDAYLEALDQLTGHAAALPEGAIAGWKFGSNDGWWVTPEECAGALDTWQKVPRSLELSEEAEKIVSSEYWKEWISFLERAAVNGGFRVF